MKKSTKLWSILLTAALLLTLLAGCGANKTPSSAATSVGALSETTIADKEVTLTFWTPTWRQKAEEPIIADFMKKHPNIKIEATYMSSDDIKANTKIAASSGTLPDMWYNWGG
ncbi:MAG: hypothetical protein RR956_08210, partial [Christensenella sp.]